MLKEKIRTLEAENESLKAGGGNGSTNSSRDREELMDQDDEQESLQQIQQLKVI